MAKLHIHAIKFTINLINGWFISLFCYILYKIYKLHYVGCPNASTYFWSTFMLEYLYPKTVEANKAKTKCFNGFKLVAKILHNLPHKCLPYMASHGFSWKDMERSAKKWKDMDTPMKRIEYILEQIEKIAESEQFEPLVCQ